MNTCGTCHWRECCTCLALPLSINRRVWKSKPACCDYHGKDQGVIFRHRKGNHAKSDAWIRNAREYKERGLRRRAMMTAARREAVA